MGPRWFDLPSLISPVSTDEFFKTYWEKKPLHIPRRDAQYYEACLTVPDLETILPSPDVRYPAVRLARDGAFYGAKAYTRNIKVGDSVFNGVIDRGRVQTEYRSGATLPPGFVGQTDVKGALKAELIRQVSALLDNTDLDALIDKFTQRAVVPRHHAEPSRFCADATLIGPATRIRRPEDEGVSISRQRP